MMGARGHAALDTVLHRASAVKAWNGLNLWHSQVGSTAEGLDDAHRHLSALASSLQDATDAAAGVPGDVAELSSRVGELEADASGQRALELVAEVAPLRARCEEMGAALQGAVDEVAEGLHALQDQVRGGWRTGVLCLRIWVWCAPARALHVRVDVGTTRQHALCLCR